MKCSNLKCENTQFGENHSFCFVCGHKILKPNEEASSPPVDDNNKTPATNKEDSNVQEDTDVSPDGGPRKRKDDGELEGKPAKRTSALIEDDSVPGGGDDVMANTLQNLHIAKNSLEVQQNIVPCTLSGLVTTTEHSLSDSRASDTMSVKQASNTGHQPTVKESAMLEVGISCESENLLGASSSSNPDANMQRNQEEEDVWVRENEEADSKSNKSAGDTATKQSNGDDMDNSDSTNGSDSENDEVNKSKEIVKRTTSRNKTKNAKKLQRERKKERKRKREAERREEIRRKNEQDALNNQGSEQQKGDDARGNQHEIEDHQLEVDGKEDKTKMCHVDSEEKNKEGKEGYFDKQKGKMTIVFHAVLSPHFKFEENDGDKIFMRFGGVAFGGFQDNVVEVHPERCLEHDLILVEATLLVPCVYISRNVPYKYIVFKAKREKEKYLWEYLVGLGAMKNRCLQIPKERCQTGATWHQYDDTIFSSPSWLQSLRNKMPFLKSMDPVDGRNIATWAMLPRWEGFTTEEATTSMTAWEAVEVVNDVAYCMTQTLAEEKGHFSRNVPLSYDFSRILRDFFKEKIEKNSLPQSHEEDKKNNILPLVSSVAIAYTIYVHKVHLDPQEYAKLFSSLILHGDQENHTCSGFERLLRHFPSEQWHNLGEAIQDISRQVAKHYHHDHDWLYAVPLVHFLTQVSQPFGNSLLLMEKPKDKDDTWWGARGFDTKSVRERTYTEQSCPSLLLNVLGPLFELDPLSRRTFLLVVPLRQFGKIASSGQFAPVEIYTTLARHLSEKSYITEQERDAVVIALSVIQKDAKTTSEMKAKEFVCTEDHITFSQEALLCVISCLNILKAVASDCNFKLLCDCLRSIEVWFSVLDKSTVPEREEKQLTDKMKQMVAESFDVVKKWLKKHLLGTIPCYIKDETEKELKIWTKLLHLDWTNKECVEIWRNLVSEKLKNRLEERDCNGLVEIFTKTNMTTQHNHVQDLVSEVTFRKVESMLQMGSEGERVFKNLSVHGLESPQASKCGDLLTLMLTRCWPKQEGGIPCSSKAILRHVLTWRLWPCFFQRFGGESDYRNVLNPDGQEILMKAISSVEAAMGSLKNGTTEFQMLSLLNDHCERFLDLCKHINKEERKLSSFRQLLHQRCVELTAFQEEREKVGIFITMCSAIKQVNLDKLSRKSMMDASHVCIRDLAQSTIADGKVFPVVSFFGLSPKAKEMISSMSRLRQSVLLRQLLIDNGDKARKTIAERESQNMSLGVEDVVELIWTPTNAKLQSLQARFLSGSISFGEVDELFRVFEDNQKYDDLANEIRLLALKDCSLFQTTEELINSRIEQIQQYYKLQRCIDAAKTILDFRTCLGLQGDFKLVEHLRNQMSSEFKQQPLETMNEALQEAGRLLFGISPERERCLDAVTKCQHLITWLRKTIAGPQELKVLVDLAIISGGETDIETTRITCLHTSCLGFAPLIFDLQPSFGFVELMKTCKPVWSALDGDPTLPEKLMDTNRHMEWLQSVKTSHGSVAMSSLMEAQTINEHGIYRVGCEDESSSIVPEQLTLDNVIQLTLRTAENGKGKVYSLDNLKDLQSKLMLIAAKASNGKEQVDRFVDILQCVLRLATVYISLCKAGEVSHLKWKHEFPCTPRLTANNSLINDLVNESEHMEQCLQQWKDELHAKRLQYSELNHFTTRQLLFLRGKLAVVQGRGPRAVDSIPLEVYNLLESVLPGIDQATLKSVLTFCGICSQEVGQNIIRSYGASCKSQRPSDGSDRLKLPKELQPSNIEMFQSLVAKLELLGYSEEVAIAAMVSRKDATEADLIVWSVQNGNNEDLISAKYSEAQSDPRYFKLMNMGSTMSLEQESPLEENMADESEDSSEPMEAAFTLDQTANGEFLCLDDLGKLLLHLASQGFKKGRREFPRYLKNGKPNFVVVPKEDIFGTVLSLYMHDSSQSLPTSEEVLICTSDTTAEEIELLWRRSLGDLDGRLFCLVNVDLLDYTVSQKAADTLGFLLQEPQYNRNEGLSLVVICSSENEDRAHMAAALDQYRLGTIPHCASPKEIRQYLKTQFKPSPQQRGRFRDQILPWSPAAVLDKEGLAVRVLSSERAGAGKSLVVYRLSQSLHGLKNNETVMDYLRDMEADVPLCITVPIYGPFVHQYAIAESLLPHIIIPDLPLSRVFHLDVHPSVKGGLDTLLFNLLVLGVLESSSGQIWRRRSSDLYVIELTSGPSQTTNETTERRLPVTNRGSSKKVIAEPFHKLLPTIHCGTPMQTLSQLRTNQVAGNSLSPLFDNEEFQSSYVQRAFQYLKLWESAGDSLDRFWFIPSQVMGDHAECIETLARNCGINDPSWAELRYFVNFLNSQLQACEDSSFCNMDLVGDTLEGFRSFVVRFMILMSRDFATPSLNSCESPTATCDQDGVTNGDDEEATAAEVVRLSLRRRWETSSHPYIFFNQDRITMTFVGFHIDQNGNLIDPDRHVIIQQNLMSRHLRTGLFVQKVDMETNYESWSKGEKIEKLCGVMGVEWPYDPDDSYELTTDNLKKILAIHMRFRCGIPVVIMGETGCGKTCLIRYMCGLQSGPGGPKNMLLLKVHGGTTYKDIEKKVELAEEMARENEMLNIDTVLFFDEANTTDALGMIKEVMVDRRVNGRKIGVGLKRLQFIAACNPYRKHTKEMIHKLESAGLGYHVATQQTHDRLGHIPLRHLVYRVHALPESMRPLVWDFGQLNPDIEELYTRQIVSRFVLQEEKIPGEAPLVKALTAVLTASQRYMRDQTDECSFVSLRDVERAMNVMVWFYNHREVLNPLMDDQYEETDSDTEIDDSDDEDATGRGENELNQTLDDVTRALVLSLGVCYQARLQDREPYRRAVARSFSEPCRLPGGHQRISQEITRCQKAVLNQLDLGDNIARNTALSENVFMMVVCIELRIPLFVVGKPGSSKSLAKTVVADNMEGDASRSDLFKTFKQVHMVSYQCSPLSTAEGIMATFRQCSKLQNGKNPDKYVSVVVLDEIGLAEDSPLMPLKTLHPLLEDGVSSTDDIIQVEKQLPERVAFIGISNWALDPAKMNRGIMLSRGLPDAEELVESAMGICSTDQRIQSFVAPLMNPLALGYEALYDTQRRSKTLQDSKKDEFFGLRDFYSLVKMVYKMAEEHKRDPSWPEVEHAIRRNFGGLDEIDPVKVFRKHFRRQFSLGKSDTNKDAFSAVNLIKASLERQISRGESRYLLVLTENYAALPIVQEELLKKKEDPVIIFGSSFPKDQEYTQVCRNINRIKVCMETGRTVILLNLESLYESLYDALNQYYVYFGGQKFVDLGLGSHRVKCRVHDAFRLIVIAERDVVYSKFPIPLINRLEKHYLVTSASLSSAQTAVVLRLQDWVTKFSHVNVPRHQQMRTYSPGDAFVGYHGDTAASVVLQVCSNIDQRGQQSHFSDPHSWEEEVYKQSQELLLRCATPDAVARLQYTQLGMQSDKLWETYFTAQEHSSLTAFLRNVLTAEERKSDKGTLIQVTTHSRLLSSSDLQDISSATSLPLPNVTCLSLQQFHTEQQFCSSVSDFFAKLGGREGLLLVQCDAGDLNCNLIPCARHLLVEQRTTSEQDLRESIGHNSSSFIHIVLIVQLPRLVGGCPTFVGFQGGRWLSIHIDELRPPTGQIPAIQFMVDRSVSELFDVAPSATQVDDMDVEEEQKQEEITDIDMEITADVFSGDTNLDKVDIVSLLRSCVQAAVARIDDESLRPSRSTRRIELMLSLLPDCRSRQTDLSFATILARRIHKLLQEKDERAGMKANDWLRSEALSGTGIQENGTFRKALWQRVYSSVIPILSEVIAYVDRDSNLELVTEEGNGLSRLWIQLFQNHSMVQFHYDGFLSLEGGIIRERVPVITAGRERQVFDSRFPFSWLIKEKFDDMWRGACSIASRTNTPVQQRLRDLANASEMGKLLEETEYEGYEESAVLRYLHDFVHMVHKSVVPEEEQLISQAIVTASRELHGELESNEEFVLTISLIHVVYDRIEKRLTNFSHLVRAQPDIVTRLLQVIPPNESELVLDAVALQLCLSNLEPTAEEFSDPQTRLVWCNRVLSIRSSADNMISNVSHYGPKTARILQECKSTWQRVSAVRLFIEHTCPGTLVCHPADIKNVFKLWKALGDETDFTKPHTMRVIEKFLVDCSEAVSKRYTSYGVTTCPVCLEGLARKDPVKMPCDHVICLVCVTNWIERERTCPLCKQDIPDDFKILSTKSIRKAVKEHYDFRRRCNSFFMELVSLFCFGANAGRIDPELFTLFMSYVIKGSSRTKDFSPFPEHGIDATPVVRSFLLQQLLRTGDKEVKENLAHYLSEARGLRPDMEHLLQVCQLFVHCWEDSLISLYSKTSGNLLVMIKLAQQLCHECTPLLTSRSLQQHTRELDIVVLEGVAKARYTLALVADFMNKTAVARDTAPWNDLQIRNELENLFDGVRRMCCEGSSPVPRLYLLKQSVRRYGVESIHVLCGIKAFEWIVPPESRDKQQEDLVPDRFVIYGEDYKKVREAMAKTVLSATHRELTKVLQSTVLPPVVRDVMMLLSEYREVTTCYGFRSAQRQLSTKAHQCFQEFLKDDAHLSARAQPFATQLLDNTQGVAGFPGVRVAPGRSALEQNLAEIVIHTTAVLQCINQMTVCEPLRLLMDNPTALMNAFFPTMPDDNLEEAMAGMRESGSWYQCPKGHPYYVGNCGRPVEVKVCPECKVNIGGAGYQLSRGNAPAQRADRTMKGHVLGHPSARPKSLAPERNLSPVVVGIIRILMHCAMIEGACRHPQGICSLVNPRVPPEALPRFLWDHLRLDVELLASSLGRSIDDTVLCLHMTLVQMTAYLSNPQQAMNVAYDLKSKESRRDWETAFNASVVTPVLTNLEEQIQRCLQMLVGDKRLGNNPLMRQLYEVDVLPEALTDRIPPTCPALWRYRTQVTLEHFSHTFQQEVLSTDPESNKVLAEFLRQEHNLRALRFLPDIVKLQRLLMDKFHRRIDRAEAEHITIRDFLRKIPSKTERDELASLIASFNHAWNHVRLSLDQQGRLRPPTDLCEKTMDNTRPLAVLLPCTSGMGICSTALVFFLTTVHNEFNERFQNLIGGQVKDLPHIPLQDVTSSNLISYHIERDLLPLILAQCNYSLEVGRGTLVQYNWEALERQLIDRFIRGRQLVDFKDERFAFSRDIQLDSVFASVKAKVHPQVPLRSAVSHQILGEFRSLTDICDVLSSLDIAIGFLSSTGGSPDMLLNHYLQHVLRMSQQNNLHSLKAQQCCQLRHVISLWRLLTLERARLLMKRGEDPFEQIADTYKNVMSSKQMMKFSNSMRRIDLDRFVSELLELIVLNLRGDATPGEEDWSLSEYIQWHLDNKEHEPISGLDELSPDVQLKHVINAWQTSVELWDSYHEKRDSSVA